ncbi:hypothetical protein [Ectothiorhodospira sp. BSL-9]|nr:hypothetical protein [Ectothiorhodospira sp. BSL-9]
MWWFVIGYAIGHIGFMMGSTPLLAVGGALFLYGAYVVVYGKPREE